MKCYRSNKSTENNSIANYFISVLCVRFRKPSTENYGLLAIDLCFSFQFEPNVFQLTCDNSVCISQMNAKSMNAFHCWFNTFPNLLFNNDNVSILNYGKYVLFGEKKIKKTVEWEGSRSIHTRHSSSSDLYQLIDWQWDHTAHTMVSYFDSEHHRLHEPYRRKFQHKYSVFRLEWASLVCLYVCMCIKEQLKWINDSIVHLNNTFVLVGWNANCLHRDTRR